LDSKYQKDAHRNMFYERSQKEGWGDLRKKYSIMFEKLTKPRKIDD